MNKASEEKFNELHNLVTLEFLKRVKSGEASAHELKAACDWLKTNDVTGVAYEGNPLDKLNELSDIQQKMLQRCASWLNDDGYIIYSVCSLLKEEGEAQIGRFLRKNERFSVVHPKKRGYLDQEGLEIHKESGIRIMPFFEEGIGGTEGFYIAYLKLKGKSN